MQNKIWYSKDENNIILVKKPRYVDIRMLILDWVACKLAVIKWTI